MTTMTSTPGFAVPTAAAEPMELLADRAWDELARARNSHPIVPATCAPVLYFGDAAAYRSSPLRVVTVGLNPSDREFPQHDPWLRFPGADQRERYLHALNQYFEAAPLDWFGCFREILRGLGASFGVSEPNRAVHTDLCSVVPTAPTWSRLTPAQQRDLADAGLELWHQLITELRPHAIIASVKYSWLDRLRFVPLSDWAPVHTVHRARPYLLNGRTVQLPDGSTSLVVRGRAANTPFGTISNADRYAAGQSIRRSL